MSPDLASVAAGTLVALAVAVMLLPARRPVPQRAVALPARPRRTATEMDIGLLLTEVATLLRAGATPGSAWARTLERNGIVEGSEPGPDGVPPALLALARTGRGWSWPRLRGPGGRARSGEPDQVRRDGSGVGGWSRRARARRRALEAAVPGAAAACRLTACLGAPLAAVLEAVALGVAESGRAEDSRRTALSGPLTTARLLAGLPLLGLLLGGAVGAHPLELLLDGGWGSLLGLAGLGLMGAGTLLTRRLVSAATVTTGTVDEALVLDLAGAALSAGAAVPGALVALGQALEEEPLVMVGRALLLGAPWDEAWRVPQDPRWQEGRARLERCLRPGWEDGASPGPLLVGAAAALRAGRRAADQEAAERLAVRLVVPLGLCHLPAFVVIGIVPVVASVGVDLVHG